MSRAYWNNGRDRPILSSPPSKSDKEFDNDLIDILTKDQQKRHKKWKEDRKKAGADEWPAIGRPGIRGAGEKGVTTPGSLALVHAVGMA